MASTMEASAEAWWRQRPQRPRGGIHECRPGGMQTGTCRQTAQCVRYDTGPAGVCSAPARPSPRLSLNACSPSSGAAAPRWYMVAGRNSSSMQTQAPEARDRAGAVAIKHQPEASTRLPRVNPLQSCTNCRHAQIPEFRHIPQPPRPSPATLSTKGCRSRMPCAARSRLSPPERALKSSQNPEDRQERSGTPAQPGMRIRCRAAPH